MLSTDDAVIALRKATQWAQSGMIVSTGPPVEPKASTDSLSNSEKKKSNSETVCREKNAQLARSIKESMAFLYRPLYKII